MSRWSFRGRFGHRYAWKLVGQWEYLGPHAHERLAIAAIWRRVFGVI